MSTLTAVDCQAIMQRAKQLYSKEQVEQAIARIGQEMTLAFKEENPLLLCVMQGGLVFMGSLLTHCNFPLQIDYVHASRYRGDTSGGVLNWLVKPTCSLQDRTVVIVDDILDAGITLAAIIDYCRQQGAKEVVSAVLVDKMTQRSPGAVEVAEYTGLKVEDYYLFGYGMDYKEYLRNAPGIYAVHPEDK